MTSPAERLALFGVKRRTRRSLGYPGALAAVGAAGLIGIGGLTLTIIQGNQAGKHVSSSSQDPKKNDSLSKIEESYAHAKANQLAQKLITDPQLSEWRRIDGNISSATIYVHDQPIEAEVAAERGVTTRTKPTPYSKSGHLWTWLHPTLNPNVSWQMEVEIERDWDIPGVKDVIRFAVLEDIKRTPPTGEKPLDPQDFPLFATISWQFVDPSGKYAPSPDNEIYGTFLKPRQENLPDPIKIVWPKS